MTPRIAGLIFKCGECDRERFKRVKREPSIDQIADIRQRARCGQCGAKGSIEIVRDSGWTPGEIDKLEAYLNGTNRRTIPDYTD